MKGFFTAGSIFFTVLILILAFENIGGAKFQYFLLLFVWLDQTTNPFFIVLGLCLLGIIAGIFYTGLVMQLLKGGDEEENGGSSL